MEKFWWIWLLACIAYGAWQTQDFEKRISQLEAVCLEESE